MAEIDDKLRALNATFDSINRDLDEISAALDKLPSKGDYFTAFGAVAMCVVLVILLGAALSTWVALHLLRF